MPFVPACGSLSAPASVMDMPPTTTAGTVARGEDDAVGSCSGAKTTVGPEAFVDDQNVGALLAWAYHPLGRSGMRRSESQIVGGVKRVE
jgi:hypothetical protein